VQQLSYFQGAYGEGDITAASNATTASSGGVNGFVDSNGVQRYSFIDENQHIQEIVFNQGVWSLVDLTNAASVLPIVTGGRIGGFATSYDQHWIYEAADGHIYQIVLTNSTNAYSSTDLTSAASAPLAGPDSGISGYVDLNGYQHFVYVGTDQHVFQIVYSNSTWGCGDLTVAANAPIADIGSAVSAFVDGNGEQHYVYVSGGQMVWQIGFYNGTFGIDDMSQAAGAPAVGGGVAPTAPVREYLYFNGRVVAIENGGL
jgi:hypothetical protein